MRFVLCLASSLLLICLLWWGSQIFIRKWVVERNKTGSIASHAGRLRPNLWLIRDLSPGLYPQTLNPIDHFDRLRHRIFIARQLWHGASNPAVVVSHRPLIVAAYAADCDAVLLVRFLPETAEPFQEAGLNLSVGAYLLSVNTYLPWGYEYEDDEVVQGPRSSRMWSTFRPYIADFMSIDDAVIAQRKAEISADLWGRTRQLGEEKLANSDWEEGVRWGNPMFVYQPLSFLRAIAYAEHWNIPY